MSDGKRTSPLSLAVSTSTRRGPLGQSTANRSAGRGGRVRHAEGRALGLCDLPYIDIAARRVHVVQLGRCWIRVVACMWGREGENEGSREEGGREEGGKRGNIQNTYIRM